MVYRQLDGTALISAVGSANIHDLECRSLLGILLGQTYVWPRVRLGQDNCTHRVLRRILSNLKHEMVARDLLVTYSQWPVFPPQSVLVARLEQFGLWNMVQVIPTRLEDATAHLWR